MSRKKTVDLDAMDEEEFESMMIGIDDSQAEDFEIGGDSDPEDVFPLNTFMPRSRTQKHCLMEKCLC